MGLSEVCKKSKSSKSGVCATYFMGLEGFGGDFKEGVYLDRLTYIKNF